MARKRAQEETPEVSEEEGQVVQPELSPYEQEMQERLDAFRQEEELPVGLRHGLWSGQRQYVCLVCDVGYLSREAAETHLLRHPEELEQMRQEQASGPAEVETGPEKSESTDEVGKAPESAEGGTE